MNPEFEKNLWREMTPHRLVITPLAIGLLAFLAILLDDNKPGNASVSFAFFTYSALIFLYGPRLAFDTVMDEVRQGTWDNLRLSTLTPWALTWGKLLGGTLHAWYGGILSLIWLMAVSLVSTPGSEVVRYALIMVAVGLACHALSTMSALMFLEKARTLHHVTPPRLRGGYGISLTMLVILMIIPSLLENEEVIIHWWGWRVPGWDFALAAVIMFLFWFLLGVRQLFASALNFPPNPRVWLGFTLFSMLFVAGFPFFSKAGQSSETLAQTVFIMASVGILLSYFMAFQESMGPSVFLNLLHDHKTENQTALFNNLPRSLLSLALSGLLILFLLFLPQPTLSQKEVGWSILMSVLLFAVRDFAFFAALQQGQRPERARSAILVYLLFFYGVFPTMFGLLEWEDVNILFLPGYEQIQLGAKLPLSPPALINSLIIGAGEAMIALIFLSNRLQRVLATSSVTKSGAR